MDFRIVNMMDLSAAMLVITRGYTIKSSGIGEISQIVLGREVLMGSTMVRCSKDAANIHIHESSSMLWTGSFPGFPIFYLYGGVHIQASFTGWCDWIIFYFSIFWE